jgi:hypothetical protein
MNYETLAQKPVPSELTCNIDGIPPQNRTLYGRCSRAGTMVTTPTSIDRDGTPGKIRREKGSQNQTSAKTGRYLISGDTRVTESSTQSPLMGKLKSWIGLCLTAATRAHSRTPLLEQSYLDHRK